MIDPTCGQPLLLGAFGTGSSGRWVDAEPGTNRRGAGQRASTLPAASTQPHCRRHRPGFRYGRCAAPAATPASMTPPATTSIIRRRRLLTPRRPARPWAGQLAGDEVAAVSAHGYATEDVGRGLRPAVTPVTVVVRNLPYPTVKDPPSHFLSSAVQDPAGKGHSASPSPSGSGQLAHCDSRPERADTSGMITAPALS